MSHRAVVGGFAALLSILSATGCSSSSAQPASNEGDSSDQDGNPGTQGGSSSGSSGGEAGPTGASSGGGSSGGSGSSGGTRAGDDGSADAPSDGPSNDTGTGQPDAGDCAPCPAMYSCVAAPSGLQVTETDTQDPDGTCHVSGIKLYCGGTGTAANGSAVTWAAGSTLGPSGGPGIVIHATSLQLNCE